MRIRPASSGKGYLPQGEKCALVAEAFISLHKGKTGHMVDFALIFNSKDSSLS